MDSFLFSLGIITFVPYHALIDSIWLILFISFSLHNHLPYLPFYQSFCPSLQFIPYNLLLPIFSLPFILFFLLYLSIISFILFHYISLFLLSFLLLPPLFHNFCFLPFLPFASCQYLFIILVKLPILVYEPFPLNLILHILIFIPLFPYLPIFPYLNIAYYPSILTIYNFFFWSLYLYFFSFLLLSYILISFCSFLSYLCLPYISSFLFISSRSIFSCPPFLQNYMIWLDCNIYKAQYMSFHLQLFYKPYFVPRISLNFWQP